MDSPEKLATLGTQDEDKKKTKKKQHNTCWIHIRKQTQIT